MSHRKRAILSTVTILSFIGLSAASAAAELISFAAIPPNGSVEGLGTVDARLNIQTSHGLAQVERPGSSNSTYGWNGAPPTQNGGMDPDGGFADTDRDNALFDVAFTFAPGVAASDFSIRMLDFGDFNPYEGTLSVATLRAMNAANVVVATQTLSFTHDADINPTSGSAGNLQITGDATAAPGDPGNFVFSLSAPRISRVEFVWSHNGSGNPTRPSDPNIGFDTLEIKFVEACHPCDANCDGSVNGFDVDPFVALLTGGGTPCSPCAGDVNGDGSVSGFDIDNFVACLGG
ncbi:MAG: hypothetical protein CHACPFDD_00109 [Phycisphaerae bacterium]|nr:hypothetical protein [Phycisphaerae bacterium]